MEARMAHSPRGEELLKGKRMSCADATLPAKAAGVVGLWEGRHPAERACLQIWSCRASCCPQPLFIADERHVKLMMVV